jgi:hypothetical protein
MNRLLLKLAITAALGSLLSSNPAAAQLVPDAKRLAVTTHPTSTALGALRLRWRPQLLIEVISRRTD